MIRETVSRKNHPAITSNRWHVVHAEWDGSASAEPQFQRRIVSEHDERARAVEAGRALIANLAPEMAGRERTTWDQIFVRRPDYKSLKASTRVARRK